MALGRDDDKNDLGVGIISMCCVYIIVSAVSALLLQNVCSLVDKRNEYQRVNYPDRTKHVLLTERQNQRFSA